MQYYWLLCIFAVFSSVSALPRTKRSPQFFYPGFGGHGFGFGGWGPYGHGNWGGPGYPGMRFHPRPFGSAYCHLIPANNSKVMGEIYLDQPASLGPVQISGEIFGLTPGRHGFHIHERGETEDDCEAAGPHFNPTNMMHGAPDEKNRHVGDLGNIEAGAAGIARFELADSEISLVEGNPRSVLMRSMVVHAMEDDLGRKEDDASSKMSGNSGARLACCIIEKPKLYY